MDLDAFVLTRLIVSTCIFNLRNAIQVVVLSIGSPNSSVEVSSNVTD